jgi:hypothetical protein
MLQCVIISCSLGMHLILIECRSIYAYALPANFIPYMFDFLHFIRSILLALAKQVRSVANQRGSYALCWVGDRRLSDTE